MIKPCGTYLSGAEADEIKRVSFQRENRLERFAKLCIRIGINDKYAIENGIINETELKFIHEVMDEISAIYND